ncbi:hypothetical protein EDC96DRAFT_452593 [Choanephora cucurbitarum]|nr:hypothetical protein EDC96DRAFT_452593 [Choanephora cucurbitarum]
MGLAEFPLLVRRWRRSTLYYAEYNQYSQLREYLPEDIFISRLATIDEHVRHKYPHVWIDTYAFVTAVVFVMGTAAFSVIARAAELSMWYPLLLLAVPAFVAFFTTRRKSSYYRRLSDYYESLQSCLKELNSLDVTRQIKWNCRRMRESDTIASLHLKPPSSQYTINFVIEVIQINVENELAQEMLPAYDTSMMDVVLAVGPEAEQVPGNQSNYITQNSQEITSHPSPPPYEHQVIEMQAVQPPPAYLTEPLPHTTSNTPNTSGAAMASR